MLGACAKRASIARFTHPPDPSRGSENGSQPGSFPGGPSSVTDDGAPTFDAGILDIGPLLGVCYGMQWIAHTEGVPVVGGGRREYGRARSPCVRRPACFPGSMKESARRHGCRTATM
ncbi:MAG: hypothetical protein U0163_12770 [Gemmatimonadaceae bacterium]